MQSSNSTSKYLLKRNENIHPHEDPYTNVRGSFTHNYLKTGNNPTVYTQMNGFKIVYPYNESIYTTQH